MDLTIFIAITSAAVVIQAGILVAMFLALRKTSSKMESCAEDIRTQILPTAEVVRSMLTDFRPKLESTMTNVLDVSSLLRAQIERLDATISDTLDRTRRDYPRRRHGDQDHGPGRGSDRDGTPHGDLADSKDLRPISGVDGWARISDGK